MFFIEIILKLFKNCPLTNGVRYLITDFTKFLKISRDGHVCFPVGNGIYELYLRVIGRALNTKKNLKEGRLREFGCEIATYQLS